MPATVILAVLSAWQDSACVGAQVQKLSDGDVEETARSLYNRNVSSSKLLEVAEPLPEPKRMAGSIISFKRSGVCLSAAGSLQ